MLINPIINKENIKGDVRDKLLEKYAHFKNVLAQKIAARKPGADGEYLAWLTPVSYTHLWLIAAPLF